MKAKETAVVLIEFQNDFCKAGGKLLVSIQVRSRVETRLVLLA
jgi:nicotinamidase-related amidase